MCKELDRLDELYEQIVENIPDFTDLVLERAAHKSIYRMKEGVMESECILSHDDISIAKTRILKNASTEFHKHKVKYEILIVLDGEVTMDFKNKDSVLLKKHDYIVLENGNVHAAKANEDATLIALTVPKDEGFPT